MSASAMRRTIYDDVHKEFRESVRTFLEREAVPHAEEWEEKGMVDRSFWRKAAAAGFVGFEAPEEHGGIGVSDFRFNAIIDEEVEYLGVVSDNFALENDIVAPYLIELANEEQQRRWLPKFTSGDLVVAIAMTEPGAGFFNLDPQGDNVICVCRGTACHTRNSRDLLARLCLDLGLGKQDVTDLSDADKLSLTTPDHKFTIRTVACFGQCALAPVVEVNHHILSHVSERTLQREVKMLKQGGQ